MNMIRSSPDRSTALLLGGPGDGGRVPIRHRARIYKMVSVSLTITELASSFASDISVTYEGAPRYHIYAFSGRWKDGMRVFDYRGMESDG